MAYLQRLELPVGFSCVEKQLFSSDDPFVFEEIKTLRKLAWENNYSSEGIDDPEQLWFDTYDNGGYFTMIFFENKLVACSRMTLHTDVLDLPGGSMYHDHDAEFPVPIASYNRLVVDAEFRGKGLSQYILSLQNKKAKSLGAQSIALDCAVENTVYHEKIGFQKVGKPNFGKTFPAMQWQAMVMRVKN